MEGKIRRRRRRHGMNPTFLLPSFELGPKPYHYGFAEEMEADNSVAGDCTGNIYSS